MADHELTRLCMAADGRVKAQFSDNSILLLSPNGRAFMHIDKDGNVMRQLSDCAISRHLVPLAIAIEFRNLHVASPSFCSKLKTPRESLVLGFCMNDLYWPMSLEEADAKGLLQLSQEDGKITIGTEDGCGQIVLHQNRRRFGISYPLLIRDLPHEGAWEYVWQTQVFSLLSFPSRWEPIVSLVLKAAKELNQAEGGGGSEPADEVERRMAEEWEDREALFATSGSGRRTPLPQALEGGYGSPPGSCAEDYCTVEGWWSEPTLALLPEDLLLIEWTPQATYQFHPTEPYEVEAWIHEDESCLSTLRQGRFLAHHRPSSSSSSSSQEEGRPGVGPTEQVYAAESVPESSWSFTQGSEGGRYALAPLAAHAVKLRQHMAGQLLKASGSSAYGLSSHLHTPTHLNPVSIITALPLPLPHSVVDLPTSSLVDPSSHEGRLGNGEGGSLDPEWAFAVSSDVVVEEEVVPQQGTFTAYADGRLRCFFEDRTILHMDPSRTYCKMLMSDGARVIVTVENPVGVEAYVQAAASFAVWAFKPQEEREREARERALAEAEVAASMRMAQLLEWTAAKPSSVRPPNPYHHPGGLVASVPNPPIAKPPSSQPPASGFSPEDVEAMLRKNRELVEKLLI